MHERKKSYTLFPIEKDFFINKQSKTEVFAGQNKQKNKQKTHTIIYQKNNGALNLKIKGLNGLITIDIQIKNVSE